MTLSRTARLIIACLWLSSGLLALAAAPVNQYAWMEGGVALPVDQQYDERRMILGLLAMVCVFGSMLFGWSSASRYGRAALILGNVFLVALWAIKFGGVSGP